MLTTPTRTQQRKRTRAIHLRRMSLEQIYKLAERLEGRPVPGVRMSEEEFVAWCGEEIRAEWIDGEVILMAPVSDEHNDLNVWLIRLLGGHVEEHDLGIIRYDMSVRFAGQRRRRVPDLLFVSNERRSIVHPTYLEGAPDLVIELISADSQSRDRREKYQEYEKAGVQEYWIIDQLSRSTEMYRLVGKKFELVEELDGTLESTVLKGFRLKTDLLWRKPLPKVAGVLKQMRSKR